MKIWESFRRIAIAVALSGLAHPVKRRRLLPRGLAFQLWSLAAISTLIAVWLMWGSLWLAPIMGLAFGVHIATWFLWWRMNRKLKEADAADPPENIIVRLSDGQTIAVDCAYMYTDKNGIRVWQIVTPLPTIPIKIWGKIPPHTEVKPGE